MPTSELELGTPAMQNLAAGGLILNSWQLTANIKLTKCGLQNYVLGHHAVKLL